MLHKMTPIDEPLKSHDWENDVFNYYTDEITENSRKINTFAHTIEDVPNLKDIYIEGDGNEDITKKY